LTVETKRWKLAQEYEQNWWSSRQSDIDFIFYKEYADDLREKINQFLVINDKTKILEVGSGAGGIVTYLTETSERYAIDPLEDFYSSIETFKQQRDKEVKYYSAMGEDIPFDDNMFNLIIMDNVLDHCEDPIKVMHEVNRVLNGNGKIYFKQNSYHLWGSFIRFMMEKLLVDKGHPHTFSKRNLLNLIRNTRLNILRSDRAGYLKTWLREFKSNSTKDKIKALLFVTRDKVMYILAKNE